LATGTTVILQSDGTVKAVAEVPIPASVGTQANAANVNSEDTAVVFDSATDKFTLFYADRSNSDYGTYVVGTISGTSITFGTPAVFNSAASTNIDAVYDEASGNIVVVWAQSGTGGRSIVGSRSGDTITFGSAVTFDSNSTFAMGAAYIEDAEKVFISYQRNSAGTGHGIVGTVSGTSISFGSAATMPSSVNPRRPLTAYVGSSKAVVATRDNNASPTAGKAVVATISGTSVSFGSFVTFETQGYTGTGYQTDVAYDSANDKVVIAWTDGGNSGYGTAIVGTVSGTSISFGTAVVFASTNTTYYYSPTIRYSVKSGNIFTVYVDASDSDRGKYILGTVSGTSISFAGGTTFTTDEIAWLSLAVNDTNNKFAVGYKDNTAGGDPSAQIIQDAYTSTNSANFVGITDEAIANAATGSVVVEGGVITNSSLINQSLVSSEAVFDTDSAQFISVTYDSSNDRIVVAYADGGNSNFGTAVVGTVSSNSISFGTPVIFNSGQIGASTIAYDSNAQKVVIAYQDVGASNIGNAIVGTVSGTSISFGSEATFETSTISTALSSSYDSNAQKIVIVYQDGGNSDYGTAIVGTVSGTGITFGSSAAYLSAGAAVVDIAYDANAQKHLIVFQDGGNSNYTTGIVATVSGTSISFGTKSAINAYNGTHISVAYDSTATKLVVAYRSIQSFPYKPEAVVATISGTSVSFGSTVLDTNFSSGVGGLSIAYSPAKDQTLMTVRDESGGKFGYVFLTVSGTSISFGTSATVTTDSVSMDGPRFIAYDSSSQSLIGCVTNNTDTAGESYLFYTLTTLTTGSTYYVQDDGSLSTTSSSVTAGKALSSTTLLLKG
jgi:hypothetical protein